MGRKVFITDNAHGTSTKDLADVPPNYPHYSLKGQLSSKTTCGLGKWYVSCLE